ncbi:hypothetical protein FRC14_002970 [Serendipita sp. 396]|nr:hypothetical protein FRC14_002970 [Serendipita sp. 396]KAG8780258.1 hypothetical protein FRC15_009666 [Serendipita sp. 397]KAG8828715.1 hypothetical protein FRC19_000103 [Serendipita sp. 401]KAG8867915.1 hypothetical protein FRC20_004536 [Serendipita sp. 405]KAG9058834.1 hypothetical protein FS842_000031 [Serendipita sp. 407]
MSATAITREQRNKLIKAAIQAKEGSYSPYSKFRVGAALLSPNGTIIKGANVENASYGGTICAERTAIVKAVTEDMRTFTALAVTTDVASTISPCGICRQVLREFCALEMPVYLVAAGYDPSKPSEEGEGEEESDGKMVLETTLGALLPHSFGPEDLPRA